MQQTAEKYDFSPLFTALYLFDGYWYIKNETKS